VAEKGKEVLQIEGTYRRKGRGVCEKNATTARDLESEKGAFVGGGGNCKKRGPTLAGSLLSNLKCRGLDRKPDRSREICEEGKTTGSGEGGKGESSPQKTQALARCGPVLKKERV